ncbi:WASHC4 [Symbiodinium sp. KB8]|nr:WASHC4 [Symbiodinium sp. KB8]
MASAMRSVFDTQEELRECGRVECRTPSSELLKPLPLGHQALRQATSCCRTRPNARAFGPDVCSDSGAPRELGRGGAFLGARAIAAGAVGASRRAPRPPRWPFTGWPRDQVTTCLLLLVRARYGSQSRLDEVEQEVGKLPVGIPASGLAPILVATSQVERIPVYDLVESELEEINPVVRRVLVSLTAVAHECEELAATAEAEYCAPLALFGWNKADDTHDWGSGQLEEMLGRALPKLQDASNFGQRCRDVALNAMQQLAGLFDASQASSALWRGAELRGVVSRLGAMLASLLAIDLVVRGNDQLRSAWDAFQRAVQLEGAAACGDAARFRALREMVLSLDEGLMSGRLFLRALQQPYDVGSVATGDAVVPVHKNETMNKELTRRAVSLAVEAAGIAAKGNAAALPDVVGGMCVYALARTVAPPGVKPSTSEFFALWKTLDLCPVVPLFGGRAVFMADDFLREFCAIPGLADRRLRPLDPAATRATAFEKASRDLPAEAAAAARAARSWALRAGMVFAETPVGADAPPTLPNEIMQERGRLVKQAVHIAQRARLLATHFLALQFVNHGSESLARSAQPTPASSLARCHALLAHSGLLKSCVLALGSLAESQKLIETTLKQYEHVIAVALPFLVKSSLARTAKHIGDATNRLSRARRGDAMATLVEVCRQLILTITDASDVLSADRCTLFSIAVSAFTQRSSYTSSSAAGEMAVVVEEATLLSSYQRLVAEATDCSFLYFVRDLLPLMIEPLALSPVRCQRLPHLIAAFTDAAAMLASTVHLPAISTRTAEAVADAAADGDAAAAAAAAAGAGGASQQRVMTRKEAEAAEAALARDPRENLVSAFDSFLRRTVLEQLVQPLCREIEADVRVQVHSVLLKHMSAPSPKDSKARSTGVLPRPAAWLLDLAPLRFVQAEVSIKAEVEAYLESSFFDQTAIALHDWRTYGEMAALACTKFGLSIADHKLPMGSAETVTSGLDVLQIMRSIHIFCRRFTYNLHEQVSPATSPAPELVPVPARAAASNLRRLSRRACLRSAPTQAFIERRAEAGAKHLNAVTVDSIRGSVMQHGTGMLNTTVNFAFQFLSRRCFPKIIAFLSDEHVNAILSKRRRAFQRDSKSLDGRFPYESAKEMQSEFGKFGVTREVQCDGQTCLDAFRRVVTEVGNALGYVRMVRTAGMRQSATAVQFLPTVRDGDIISFEEHTTTGTLTGAVAASAPPEPVEGQTAEEAEEAAAAARQGTPKPLAPETVEAAKTLDDVIKNLMESFGDESNFLVRLVEAPSGPAAVALVLSPLALRAASRRSSDAERARGLMFRESTSNLIASDKAAAASGAGKARRRAKHPLELFATLCPPLCISYVTALKLARGQLERVSKGKEAYFADDGFAVGMAFILAVLRQERAFDSMHWFQSTKEHFS